MEKSMQGIEPVVMWVTLSVERHTRTRISIQTGIRVERVLYKGAIHAKSIRNFQGGVTYAEVRLTPRKIRYSHDGVLICLVPNIPGHAMGQLLFGATHPMEGAAAVQRVHVWRGIVGNARREAQGYVLFLWWCCVGQSDVCKSDKSHDVGATCLDWLEEKVLLRKRGAAVPRVGGGGGVWLDVKDA